ncbi:MAG: hypothetical protein ABJA67_10315 [Chthonomonadales bacterium]
MPEEEKSEDIPQDQDPSTGTPNKALSSVQRMALRGTFPARADHPLYKSGTVTLHLHPDKRELTVDTTNPSETETE